MDEDVRAADTMARLIDYGMRAEGVAGRIGEQKRRTMYG